MSSDLKASIKQQEIKDLVAAHLTNFYTRISFIFITVQKFQLYDWSNRVQLNCQF